MAAIIPGTAAMVSSTTARMTCFMPVLPSKSGRSRQQGKVGWILLWLLGIPVPVLLVLFLIRGCT